MYGLKSYGADFWGLNAEQLYDLGYRPSIYELVFCIRPTVKPSGFVYYDYVLFYVDDVLFSIDDPLFNMKGI